MRSSVGKNPYTDYSIINDNDLWLNWEVEEDGNTVYSFADPTKTRYTVNVTYEILRQAFVSGDKVYEVIGTSDRCQYFDNTTVRFNNYKYKVRAVIQWKEAIVRSDDSEYLFTFVCQNNHFPEGRWNNTTSNKKLYNSSLFRYHWTFPRRWMAKKSCTNR